MQFRVYHNCSFKCRRSFYKLEKKVGTFLFFYFQIFFEDFTKLVKIISKLKKILTNLFEKVPQKKLFLLAKLSFEIYLNQFFLLNLQKNVLYLKYLLFVNFVIFKI